MTRYQKVLAGLLILQLALTAVIFWPRENAQAVDEPLLGEVETADVERVSIAAADGRTLVLARDGQGWVLASGGDYPVNAATVNGLLAKLTAVYTNRLVTRTAASHNRLQVADDNFARRIQLTLADDSTRTLYMGTAANAQAAHIRRAGQDTVYVASNLTSLDASTTAGDWIDTGYVSLPQEEITAVVVENANGNFAFSKSAAGEWTVAGLEEGETYDPARFNAILSRISNLSLTEPLGTVAEAAYGLDEPLATVAVTAENEAGTHTYTLLIGAKDDVANTYVIKWSDADYFVRASGFNVQDMVTLTRADLVVAEATPDSEEAAPGTDG